MRVSKPPEERRKEILDTAMELFAEKGIEGTSVNDIAKRIGVAQGLIYYYFTSKEQIIGGVLEHYVRVMCEDIRFILEDKTADFYEKLACVILLVCAYIKDEDGRLASLLKAPPNSAVHARAVHLAIERSLGPLETLIMQGVRASKARAEYPGLAVKVLFHGIDTVMLIENVPRGNILSLAERMLGIAPGKLKQYGGTGRV